MARKRKPRRPPEHPFKMDTCIWYEPGREKCIRVVVDRKGLPKRVKGFLWTEFDKAREWRDAQNLSIKRTGKFASAAQLENLLNQDVVFNYCQYLLEKQAKTFGEHSGPVLTKVWTGKDVPIDQRRQDELEKKLVRYTTDIRMLTRFLEHPAWKRWREMRVLHLTKGHVKEYIEWRMETPWQGPPEKGQWKEESIRTPAATTVRREIGALSLAWKFLQSYYDDAKNHWETPGTIEGKQHTRKSRRLKPGELKKLLAACGICRGLNKIYMPLAIFILVETGMRIDELLRLRWIDVNIDNKTIYIYRAKSDYRKNDPSDKGRTIPLTIGVDTALRKLVHTQYSGADKPRGLVFGRWTYRGVRECFDGVVEEAELDEPLNIHCLRSEANMRFRTIISEVERFWMLGHAPDSVNLKHYGNPGPQDIESMRSTINEYIVGAAKGEDWQSLTDDWKIRKGIGHEKSIEIWSMLDWIQLIALEDTCPSPRLEKTSEKTEKLAESTVQNNKTPTKGVQSQSFKHSTT